MLFYYSDKSTYVSTFVRSNGSKSTFGLISIKELNHNSRLLNKDIKGSEKEPVKKEFETRILNPLKEILSKQ
jgi:hypothetical protein